MDPKHQQTQKQPKESKPGKTAENWYQPKSNCIEMYTKIKEL